MNTLIAQLAAMRDQASVADLFGDPSAAVACCAPGKAANDKRVSDGIGSAPRER